MDSVSPYLDAIQAIEGTTPAKKYKTIIKKIKSRVNIETKEINPVIWDETNEQLHPFYKTIIANMIQDYDIISDLLKSEDQLIIGRILKYKWYFQGKNKDVINAEYFFQNIIPFVTTITRREIIKSLGRYLKDTELAGEFFNAFVDNFGIPNSIPLLFACNDEFVKKQILKHKIIFNINQVDRLYLHKPNVIIYYFNLIRLKNNDRLSFNISNEHIRRYRKFLPKLIKTNHKCFCELYRAWKNILDLDILDKRYAKIILKRRSNGKRILEEDPKLFIKLISLHLINEIIMNTIFPKLLPTSVHDFSIDYMLSYLEYYPSNKKYKLISESYETMYNQPFTENLDNFSFELLPVLPRTVRLEILPQLKSHLNFSSDVDDYIRNYDCYLPTNFNWQRIKNEINKTASVEDRVALVIQMIYNCKINDDSNTLCKFLEHIQTRHKNERIAFWNLFFQSFGKIYSYSDMRLEEWVYIDNIIKDIYTQNMFRKIENLYTILQNSIVIKCKETPTHKSLKEMTDIFLDIVRVDSSSFFSWCRYIGEPEKEELFFVKMVDCVEEKFPLMDLDPNSDLDLDKWNKNVKIRLISDLVNTMYNLDKKFSLYTKKKIMKKQLLPNVFRKWSTMWLWLQVKDILSNMNNEKVDREYQYYVNIISNLVKEKDPKLYEILVNEPMEIPKINFLNRDPFKMLRNKPEEVLQKLELFLEIAEGVPQFGRVKSFFLKCRWYENISMKFVEKIKELLPKNSFYLYLLAVILDGESYQNFVLEYINDYEDVNSTKHFILLMNALRGIQVANPPISIKVVDDFHKYEYRMTTLEVSKNVSIHTSQHKIQKYLSTIPKKLINVTKNAIRIFFLTQTIDKSAEYFLSVWNKSKHYSIRQVIFQRSYNLFQTNPREKTWNTLKNCMKTYKSTDWEYYPLTFINTDRIPEEYINELIELSISIAARMIDTGNKKSKKDAIEFVRSTLIEKLSDYSAKILNEKISLNFIEKYLFNPSFVPSKLIIEFTINKYLLIDEEKCLQRIKEFENIFERINQGWKDPVLKDQPCHVRSRIVTFIETIMETLLKHESENKINANMCGKIIDEITRIFFKVPIYNDIRSYIMLQLTKFYLVTPKEFVDNVCDIVVSECKKHKCSYPILTEALEFFIYRREDTLISLQFKFIKGLLKNDNCSLSKMTAVSLLPEPHESIYPIYYETLEQMKALQDEEVLCLLYHKINRIDLNFL